MSRSPRWVSPAVAISAIKSGDTVALGNGCAEPQTLVEELVRQHERFNNVRLLTTIPAGNCDYAMAGLESNFRVLTFVSSASLYQAIKAGRVEHIPSNLSAIPRLFTDGYITLDVAMIQVSPVVNGYCSFGISVDYTKAAAETAKVVIAEVNERMPRTGGDSLIHVSAIDYLVESSRPLQTIETSVLSEVEIALGDMVARLVADGDTIQLGLGAIPDAILRSLRHKRGLRIHTGIISNGVIDLIQSGALAPYEPGQPPIVAMMAMGDQSLYDYMHDNPSIEMHPCTYTHNIAVLSKVRRLVSINSAIQVDLTGQVNAESVGGVQLSGVGGQLDFVRGAALSTGGKSIIALPSTAAGGKVSRIVRVLPEGTPVTTPRSEVHYVVTEYGVADLRGKTFKERGRALAAIAHPEFRDGLLTGVK